MRSIKRKFLQFLKERFNSGVKYKGKTWRWDTIILNKPEELSRFLLGNSQSLDFAEPAPSLIKSDSLDLRKRILELTQRQAEELGIGRTTLHYLPKSAEDRRPFKVYKRVRHKLELPTL